MRAEKDDYVSQLYDVHKNRLTGPDSEDRTTTKVISFCIPGLFRQGETTPKFEVDIPHQEGQ